MPQPVAFDFHTPRIEALGKLSREHGKITCNVMVSQWLQGPGALEAELNPTRRAVPFDGPLFRDARGVARTITNGGRPVRAILASDFSDASAAAQPQRTRLEQAATAATLAEREAKSVLATYGVPVVEERLVQDEDEAVAAAEAAGYPVVLKVESPDLPHKTEAGVVRLDLRDAPPCASAYQSIMANAQKASPAPRITGVLVQPMIPPGVEIMVGARVDPQLGPLIVAGFGGTWSSCSRTPSIELAPVTHAEARAMLLPPERCEAAQRVPRQSPGRRRSAREMSAGSRSSPPTRRIASRNST